jgi:hypothetical protein
LALVLLRLAAVREVSKREDDLPEDATVVNEIVVRRMT